MGGAVSRALLAAVLTVAGGTGAAMAQSSGRCIVTDPTRTPLNVREGPQGRVIGTMRNGSAVRIAAITRDHKGKPWAQIVDGGSGRSIGWVFREFVSCY